MKTHGYIVLFLSLLFSLPLFSQIEKCSNGTASFFSSAPLENIDATSKSLVSVLNTENNEIVFSVPISSFQFRNKKMQQDFNENFMDSEKYPKATYMGRIKEKIDYKKDGTYRVTSTGTLTIHGVARQRTDTATLTIRNGKISLEGNFMVHVADHKIKIPTIVVYHIAENVKVKFTCNYSPVEKTVPEEIKSK